ncbi:aminotransferase class I/II-fold pyridoxal phosphate-dependent enzyme [Novosphingobium sp. M1R2S20]|uniref:Aminotransferase class I/II-fold pyridoxal phosphate-dependent enzyme n=1 Tax=Novosphingobium rhizovicinum TaxID=3228928 RepID=A0ABV3REF3_9SPHN
MKEPHTFHGGRLSDACARFGGAQADWLDLSTGINPSAWEPSSGGELDWRALPDPSTLAELERTAATYFGVDPSLCLAVPGSEAGLRALGQILQLPGVPQPLCYSTHVQAFAKPSLAGEPTVRVLGNPNNPDGALVPREPLLDVLKAQEAAGGWLLVDEAFADCNPAWSIADEVAEHRRLIVTRSFGKFFGLAGVRLGFVLGPSQLLTRLRHLQGEWPLCAAAIRFGTDAYADAPWIARARANLFVAAQRLDAVLTRRGLASRGECPLFRLGTVPCANHLFEALAQQQILTRPFTGHPHLLRFGLPGSAAALARLDAALAVAGANG